MQNFLVCLLVLSATLFAQIDTAALSDNTWVPLMDPTEPIALQGSNWAYENDFKSHPIHGFFVLGPGHVVHPQDCNFYPLDPIKKSWKKLNPPRRPTRQCMSSFAISSQDTAILHFGGGEANHQLSQGAWNASYTGIDLGGARGSRIWAYSFNRNEWFHMKGPVTQPGNSYARYPVYDPVHDVALSSVDGTTWMYSFHDNFATSLSGPSFNNFAFSITVDTRRGLMYVLSPGGLRCFNPDNQQWTSVAGAGPVYPTGSMDGGSVGLNMMDYDAINDVLVFTGEDPGAFAPPSVNTWIFKCDSLVWRKMTVTNAPQDQGHLAYNKALNLFLQFGGMASSMISRGGSTRGVWAYRYKRGPGPFAGLAPAPDARINTAGNRALLTWRPVAGVDGYNIYRASAVPYPRNFQKLNSASVTDTFYLDATAVTATAYSYKVCAVQGGVDGELSRHCYTRPGRVLAPVASVEESTVVKVSWDANPEPDIVGYNVYRAKGTAIYAGPFPSGYARLNGAPVPALEYMDTVADLKDRVARGYVVTAVNAFGNESGVSPECTTFPDSPEWAYTIPSNTPQGLKCAFRWQPNRRAKIRGVNLYRVHDGLKNTAGLITDSVYITDMPPNLAGGDGYTMQGMTFVARSVNFLGQEGFLTDQISPNNMDFSYGIATPTTAFKYSDYTPGVSAENGPAEKEQSAGALEAWPNPFNPSLSVAYRVTVPGRAAVRIFDPAGRCVRESVRDRAMGRHVERFDFIGRPAGLYAVRVTVNGQCLNKKVVYIK